MVRGGCRGLGGEQVGIIVFDEGLIVRCMVSNGSLGFYMVDRVLYSVRFSDAICRLHFVAATRDSKGVT